VVTPETEYLLGWWLVIADSTNEAWAILSLGIVANRIGLAGRLEDGVRGLHESVYQFVDIPTEVS
jgi:hypothetical protein